MEYSTTCNVGGYQDHGDSEYDTGAAGDNADMYYVNVDGFQSNQNVGQSNPAGIKYNLVEETLKNTDMYEPNETVQHDIIIDDYQNSVA